MATNSSRDCLATYPPDPPLLLRREILGDGVTKKKLKGVEVNKQSLFAPIDSHTVIRHNKLKRKLVKKMVKIRLRRTGAKKRPSYRVVVADSQAPRDGAFISIIGHFNPLTDPETIVIDEEKALTWLRQGAQPTATAARLLSKVGIMEKFKKFKEKT